MNLTPTLVLTVAAVAVAVSLALVYVLVARRTRPEVEIHPAGPNRWEAYTPAGPATIIRTFRDTQGDVFEVTTAFRRDGVHTHVLPPSMVLARTRLAQWAQEARS